VSAIVERAEVFEQELAGRYAALDADALNLGNRRKSFRRRIGTLRADPELAEAWTEAQRLDALAGLLDAERRALEVWEASVREALERARGGH